MSQHIDGVSRILAVASGKGGVGKTTVTVNLALALALDGARVGIFDADVHGPNVPLMLGLDGISAEQSRRLQVPLGRVAKNPYIPPMERYGLKVMSIGLLLADTDAVMAGGRSVGMLATQTLRDVLWGGLDYLLIDLPPGTGEPQQSLLQAFEIDGVVVVTTPQDLSLLDTGRSLELFRHAQAPILGVVENMSGMSCPHCGETIEVFHRSDRRWEVQDDGLELLGRIPLGMAISRGIDEGHPFVQAASDSQETAVFRDIAARISSRLAG